MLTLLFVLTAIHSISFIGFFIVHAGIQKALHSRRYLLGEDEKKSVAGKKIHRIMVYYFLALIIVTALSYFLVLSFFS